MKSVPIYYKLDYELKNYEWGKLGRSSLVSQLKSESDENFTTDENKKYAELWLGSHISGLSYIIRKNDKNIDLKSYLNLMQMPDLKYLFKVLSIKDILSIQIHPDKETATKLNKNFPQIYKDSNHKPEIAIALTEFHGLCGFRTINQIAAYLYEIDEFTNLLNSDLIKKITLQTDNVNFVESELIKDIMSCLFSLPKETVKDLITRRRVTLSKKDIKNYEDSIFLTISDIYPDDVGCFLVYILNVIKLQPGEAIFTPANVPHAYISGDIIECMACSDNVIRLGLTPKFIDKDVALEILSCKTGTNSYIVPITKYFIGKSIKIDKYLPNVEEFKITRLYNEDIQVDSRIDLNIDKLSIILCISGDVELTLISSIDKSQSFLTIKRGDAYFISENCCISDVKSLKGRFDLWIASP